MVAASGKAATTTHGRQHDDRAQTGGARLGASLVLLSTPGPSARFGRRPPAASFPPGPPNLGTPLAPSLRSVAGKGIPRGEGRSGSAGDLSAEDGAARSA